MAHRTHWSLSAKLALVGAPFLLLALLATAATLWVSWQLDGGAAAVNEAGRLRMQTYRMALSRATHETQAQTQQIENFERSLEVLRHGDPERPLFMPWDDEVRQRFTRIEVDWREFHALLQGPPSQPPELLRARTIGFVEDIDALVQAVETHISRWTAILHLLQTGLMAMVALGGAVLLFTGHLLVLEPVGQLKQAIEKIQGGDFSARVTPTTTSDEFGTLAEGFNDMAEHLQSMYRNLEARVAAKTAELEEKRERLASLYEVTTLVAQASTQEELAQQFVRCVRRIAHADGVALRWATPGQQSYLMLAADGLPPALVEVEQCIHKGDCDCGLSARSAGLRVIPLHPLGQAVPRACQQAGFETVVNVPVCLHERAMGEIDLFYHAQVSPSESERSLIEALASHLASALDNLRLNALTTEAAVAQERTLLARELHDSIAQSLAFLKIQVQFMRDAVAANDRQAMAQVLEEIDTGVRESYADVRELLLHFRTRANNEDIEPALATTLRKFEHQSGLPARLRMQGQGLPLPADQQIQVLHIVQEALSNVRKHAEASQVWLDVQQQPQWRFEVRDNGRGFSPDTDHLDETHVGLRIMRERAERIGARLDVISTPGHGTSIVLELPATSDSAARAASAPATVSTST